MIDDGDHEAIVVDATDADDGSGAVVLSLTVVAGAHKGELVDVRAVGLARDALDLLAEPCTLQVRDGRPRVVFD